MWSFVLVVAAGLTLESVLPVPAGWAPLVSVVLAWAAGRKLASLARAVWVFAAVAVAGLALAVARYDDPLAYWAGVAIVEFLAAVLPWWAGRFQRLSAEQRHREHGIVAEQARLRERARIAQDMHDSLGHELALIALHGGALELGPGLTDEQREMTAAVRAHAVRATERLHDLVRVLGSSEAATALRPPDESMEDLVRRAAAAGLRVRLQREGPEPEWPPLTTQAAHRVVLESLTNAARHAPGTAVTVTVARRDDGTRIDVVNEPPTHLGESTPRTVTSGPPSGPAGALAGGPASRLGGGPVGGLGGGPAGGLAGGSASGPGDSTGGGLGLMGLDERIRLVGGWLEAGPRPGGGWRVSAVVPDGAGTMPLPPYDVGVSRRITRRRLAQTAALPAGVILALLAALTVSQALTVRRTGLADDSYHRLTIGEPRAQIAALLPPEHAGGPIRLIAEPPPPAGAACEYFHAGAALTDLAPQVYRLCFAGGTLVAKNRFERA